MPTVSRAATYAALVRARKDCRACTGLTNPACCDGGTKDSGQIGPWSLWQGNLNADLVIVGQDWGDTYYFIDNGGHESSGNRTNVTLRRLLGSIGIDIAGPTAADAGGGTVFLTNAVLCLKDGGMQAKVSPDWLTNCGARFLRPTIHLIAPKVVVTLGEQAYRAVTAAYDVPCNAFRKAVDGPDGFELTGGVRCFPAYHCGARILNTHRPMELQLRDWARVGQALSAKATHGAYHLGTADSAIILLTLASLTASAAALAAAIISYCNMRRSDHSSQRFTLVVDKKTQIELNEQTTIGELASLLIAKPISVISIHYNGETPTYDAECAEPLSPDKKQGRTHPQSRRNVFISYAQADNDGTNPTHRWLDRMQKHLSPLVSEERITVWSDKKIAMGDDWQGQICAHLKTASAAILLISPSFLSSQFIRSSELPVLVKRAVDDGLVVIPVIIRPCLFSEVRFKYPDPSRGPGVFRLSSLQSANPPSRSLIEMDEGEQDRVLLAVARRVLKLADACGT